MGKDRISRIGLSFLMLFIAFATSSCKPDRIELELYTSDIQAAMAGEILEVPVEFVFDSIGDDDDGKIEKAIAIAKKYFPESAEMDILTNDGSRSLSVKSTVPMGTKEALDNYLKTAPRIFSVLIQGSTILPGKTEELAQFNKEIAEIDSMLSVDMPATRTIARIVGDTAAVAEISAIAVFVNRRAELSFRKKIGRRESLLLEFKGGDDSVYATIPVQMTIKF